MEDQIRITIAEHHLFAPKDHLLVAVSGGPDSVALLHWLAMHHEEWEVQLSCAHFNHGLRGMESDQDEEYVQKLCASLQLPFYRAKVNLKQELESSSANLQVLAREYRYRFLQETAERIGANRVAFAHHQDDQMETILMRFLRGTGSTGLVGMPYKRELTKDINVIRPFLDIAKSDLVDYLKRHHLHARIDSSNLKTDYTRNRIRLDLIPELISYNPNLSASILSLARMIKEDELYLEQLSKAAFEELIDIQQGPELRISLLKWRELPLSLQRRVIKLICNYLLRHEEEVPYIHIEAIRKLFSQDAPKHWDLPWGVQVVARYGEGVFSKKERESTEDGYCYSVLVPGSLWIPECKGRFSCSLSHSIERPESGTRVYFDYDRLPSRSFTVRTRNRGDRILLQGLGGHKKVKDIFIDCKIAKEERNRFPLFFAGDELLWIPGIRKSGIAAYNEETHHYLCCEFETNYEES